MYWERPVPNEYRRAKNSTGLILQKKEQNNVNMENNKRNSARPVHLGDDSWNRPNDDRAFCDQRQKIEDQRRIPVPRHAKSVRPLQEQEREQKNIRKPQRIKPTSKDHP